MEGIRDGFAGDDCFVCGLLWPGLRPCPRCGGAMRWVPARIVDGGVALAQVARALDTWRMVGGRDELEALLEVVHGGAPETLDALAELGTGLDELRRAWARVAPELAGM